MNSSTRPTPLIVIEHLEPSLSEWSFIEYSHAVFLAGGRNVIITNVREPSSRKKLSRFCEVRERSILEICPHHKLLILDPRARKPLSAEDIQTGRIIVVGGILGDDPPRGRTAQMLSSRAPRAVKRNIGPKQFSTDGAVFMVTEVARGKALHRIQTIPELEIPVTPSSSITLPFEYPVLDGKPVVSEELLNYLRTRGFRFE